MLLHGNKPLVLINPKIIEKSIEVRSSIEGCLSFPGLEVNIERPIKVTVEYMNLKGETCKITADDNLLAVCL